MADIRMRLGVHNLDATQVADFRNSYRGMMGISDNRGYQVLAGRHGVPDWFCWHHQQNAHIAQNMRLFLPWHRAYLYNWEMAMRDRVPHVVTEADGSQRWVVGDSKPMAVVGLTATAGVSFRAISPFRSTPAPGAADRSWPPPSRRAGKCSSCCKAEAQMAV